MAIEPGALGNHAGGQSQMAARRVARDHQFRHVEVVLFGVGGNPAEGAQAILHGRRRERNAAEAVLHVDDVPAHLEPRHQRHHGGFLGPGHPASAVNPDQGGLRPGGVAAFVDVQLGLVVVGHQVGDVRHHRVLVRGVRGPGRGGRELGEGGWGERKGEEQKQGSNA